MEKVLEIINQLRSTAKTNEKLAILKHHSDNELLKEILYYTYSDKNYGFSEKLLRQAMESYETKFILTWKNYKDMLDELSSSNINDKLREQTYEFLSLYDEEERDLYINIISNDLKIGINVKSINKAIPGLIPTFGVQLAESFFKQKEGFLDGKEFILSTKLDGNRLVAIKNKDKVEFKTRQGKVMEGLIELEEEFKDIPNGIVLDGELILKNDKNLPSDELFRETMKVARKKGEKRNLEFHVFDCIELDGFNKGYDPTPCIERKQKVSNLIKNKKWLIEVPALYIGKDANMITKLLDEAISNNQEGIMINIANSGYSCKRSKDILKVKAFLDGDMRCVDVIEGTGKNTNKLGAITVEFEYEGKLYRCDCGSGFSDFERKLYWDNPELILNKIVTIGYFEISKNKNGSIGLRFPTWKSIIRDDKDDISMN